MRRTRRLIAIATILALGAGLAGCSPGRFGGARLNADGTVDFAMCDFGVREITVAYYVGSSDSASWVLEDSGNTGPAPVAVEYGIVPPGWAETRAPRRPPADWDVVITPGGQFHRDEMLEGEWVWNTSQPFAWIPAQPCGGFEVGPGGELRRNP